jgi:hypothetical protein
LQGWIDTAISAENETKASLELRTKKQNRKKGQAIVQKVL